MKRELAEAIVANLRLSGDASNVQELRQFGLRDWKRTLRWLDDSDLTLYFLRHLQNIGSTEVLPPEVLARLEESFAQNHHRWEYLAEAFADINARFQRAGVPFAVIKGLSLVPDYCREAVLRAPSDLDYLVDKQSLPLAQRILEAAGYCLKARSDIEFKFGKPSSRMPMISDSPYSARTEPLVELHLAFWKSGNGVPLKEPEFRLAETIPHSWQGLRFPVLNQRDAFLFQVLHLFQHVLEGWVKLCWLLEMGSFLSSRSSDSNFWRKVDDRMQEIPYFAEFAAIVIGLAQSFFAAPAPALAENWTGALRSTSRLWLDNYARTWMFDEHPYIRSSFFRSAKLVLFLLEEYVPSPEMRKEVIRQRLFPWKNPERVAVPVALDPASVRAARQLQWRFVLDRIILHSGSSLRYLWELPRWRELKRTWPSAGHKSSPNPAG
jgi:hypothetical protein